MTGIQRWLSKLEETNADDGMELVICLGEYDAEGRTRTYYQPRPANHTRNGVYVDLSDFEGGGD